MMKNDNIVIIEKPETVSYESIQTLLHTAHESNASMGLMYGTANQSVEQLKKTLSNNAVCIVALDGDKLIATGTVEFREKRVLFKTFKIACLGLAGVLPEYKGFHIANKVLDKRMEIAAQKGYKYMYASSAEDNIIIRNMLLKRGFKKIDYFRAKSNNFFSVRYLKWPNQFVFINLVLNMLFPVRRFYVRTTQKL